MLAGILFSLFLLLSYPVDLSYSATKTNRTEDVNDDKPHKLEIGDGVISFERLLYSTEISRSQIEANFQSSGSLLFGIAPAEGICLGVLLSPGSFLSSIKFCPIVGFRAIYASELIAPIGHNFDGEGYNGGRASVIKPIGPESASLGISNFNRSKAVVAKLASLDFPLDETSTCVVFGYGLSSPMISLESKRIYRLGYLPVRILDFERCSKTFQVDDDNGLFFCASVSLNGVGVICSKGDMPLIMFCREHSPYDDPLWKLTGLLHKAKSNQCHQHQVPEVDPLVFTFIPKALQGLSDFKKQINE